MAKYKTHHRKLDYNRRRAVDRMHVVYLSTEQSRTLHRGGRERHAMVTELTKWLKDKQFVGEYFFQPEPHQSVEQQTPIYAFYFTNPTTAMHFKLFWG